MEHHMKLSKILFSAMMIAAFSVTTAYAIHLSPSDASALATVAAVDKNEILLGVVATHKKLNSDVTDFANMMIDQHGDNLTQILTIANDMPLSGGDSDKLAADGKKALMKLGAMSGNDFAKNYVDAMVNGHEAVLKMIDDKLMKSAKSDEIKKFLTDTRAAVATHLEHAKKLQASMKS